MKCLVLALFLIFQQPQGPVYFPNTAKLLQCDTEHPCVRIATAGSTTVTAAIAVDDHLRCHDFCVEPLSPVEIDDIAAAQKNLDEAQSVYNLTMMKIQLAHGAQSGHTENSLCWPYDSVEIRGKYALIEFHDQSCVSW